MTKVEFEKIPGAEDKDKSVWIDGKHMGVVYRGWLRNGGDQWVYTGPLTASAIGDKSLKNLAREILRSYNRVHN